MKMSTINLNIQDHHNPYNKYTINQHIRKEDKGKKMVTIIYLALRLPFHTQTITFPLKNLSKTWLGTNIIKRNGKYKVNLGYRPVNLSKLNKWNKWIRIWVGTKSPANSKRQSYSQHKPIKSNLNSSISPKMLIKRSAAMKKAIRSMRLSINHPKPIFRILILMMDISLIQGH